MSDAERYQDESPESGRRIGDTPVRIFKVGEKTRLRMVWGGRKAPDWTYFLEVCENDGWTPARGPIYLLEPDEAAAAETVKDFARLLQTVVSAELGGYMSDTGPAARLFPGWDQEGARPGDKEVHFYPVEYEGPAFVVSLDIDDATPEERAAVISDLSRRLAIGSGGGDRILEVSPPRHLGERS